MALQHDRPLTAFAARLLLLVATLAVLLGLLEVAARVAGYEPIYDVYSKPSEFWQSDWLLGWSHEPGASGVFVGPRPYPIEFRTEVRINSLGLRGPELESLPEGGYRILVMGDSFVAGFEVGFEQTFTRQLEGILNEQFDFPIQLVNAGVRGYGTDQSYLYFRERGRQLDPDLVVFVHSNNDWVDNITLHRALRPFGKPAFALREGGRIDLIGSPVPEFADCDERQLNENYEPVSRGSWLDTAWCHFRMNGADHSALFSFVVMRLMRIPAVADYVIHARFQNPWVAATAHADTPRGGGRYEEILTGTLIVELDREVRRRHAGFVLVMSSLQSARLPAGLMVSQRILPHSIQVKGNLPELIWKNDSHLTPLGHRNYALGLAPVLAQRIRDARSAPAGGAAPN